MRGQSGPRPRRRSAMLNGVIYTSATATAVIAVATAATIAAATAVATAAVVEATLKISRTHG